MTVERRTHIEQKAPNFLMGDLREIQSVLRHFSLKATPSQNEHATFRLLKGEVTELEEAVNLQDRGEIAMEIADVILYAAHLANHFDIHLDIAIPDKIARNYNKYNPHVLTKLREDGMTEQEAIGHMKKKWNRDDDKNFCRTCGRGT